MKIGIRMAIVGSLVLTGFTSPAFSQETPREPTDVFIRRMAGLPAASADGQIEIIDVGHGAMETMLSIVANKVDQQWSVSYACAESPHCAPGQDHTAVSYTLPATASTEVDDILAQLKRGVRLGGKKPSRYFIAGNLLVSINYQGFKHDYRRAGNWGPVLSRLEKLLRPPVS